MHVGTVTLVFGAEARQSLMMGMRIQRGLSNCTSTEPKWSNDELTVDRLLYCQPCLRRVLTDSYAAWARLRRSARPHDSADDAAVVPIWEPSGSLLFGPWRLSKKRTDVFLNAGIHTTVPLEYLAPESELLLI